MSYHIAFDIAHKPRGQIDENLTELRDHLNSNGFTCYNFLEVPITEESLMAYDILVFVCPDFAKIEPLEITEIVNWVTNSGGGLLLLSHAGGDRGRGSNLSEISEQFGITFESDQVLDETTNLGIENIPLISTFNIPHPITTDIGTICYRSGCSLTIVGSGALAIASSNETSEPFSCPLICVSELGNGRVCCIGSYEMFRDNIGGGFQCNDHPNLALNTFKWLLSDYRIELRSTIDIPTPISQRSEIATSDIKEPAYPSASAASEQRKIDIGFSMKINKKSELMELLKIFQSQLSTIKTTIDRLIETVSISQDDIIETNTMEITPVQEEEEQKEEMTLESSQTPEKVDTKSILEELANIDSKLTELPPKPESMKMEDTNELGMKPVPKLKTKDKSKNELKDEKKGLETKLTSVKDLLNFIDKKHSSGAINDDEYAKRSKKLQKDLKKTKKRIDILDKLLEK
ncbi:MAG: hypothetical protein ACFFB0_20695 [Promethearchaeota archaeon]